MRNSNVIREEIAEKRTALDNLQALSETEERDFTADEQELWDNDIEGIERLNVELSKVEKQEAIRAKAASVKAPVLPNLDTQKESKEEIEVHKNYSFGDAIRAAYGGKLEGLAKEMHEEGEREMARIGKSSNGIVIPGMITNRAAITENGTTGVETTSFIDGVYAQTILGNLGVSRLSSTTDQRIPIIPSITTQWEGETDAAADGGSALSKVDLSPTRLASYVDYSKQAAMQHNQSLEAALRSNIQQAIGAKVEYAVFTDDTTAGGPADIGASKTAVTGATVTAMALAAMEEVLGNNQNRGNLGFAVSHTLFAETWQAVLATGVSALVQDNMIMGLPTYFSTQIADIATGQEAIYYGDWSKFFVASFGGIEILVDPYTQAVSGKNRLVLNSYWDFALSQDSAISVAGYTG